MTREEIIGLMRDEFGAEAEYLWARYPDYCVFRHGHNRKWFAVLMRAAADKLGLEGAARDILDVKCDPQLVGSLIKKSGCLPAYHMNKTSWITLLPDKLSSAELMELVSISFELTRR